MVLQGRPGSAILDLPKSRTKILLKNLLPERDLKSKNVLRLNQPHKRQWYPNQLFKKTMLDQKLT